jgi:hypothetical protein
VHTYNPSTQEAKERSGVPGQLELHNLTLSHLKKKNEVNVYFMLKMSSFSMISRKLYTL